jgi:catabolite repression HPr-like protein
MTEKTVTISLAKESATMPVAVLVQIASQYESKIYLISEDKKINAKSIMGMMSLDFISGKEIIVTADGSDEALAVEKMSEYLMSAK